MRILYFFIKEIIALYDHHEQLNPKLIYVILGGQAQQLSFKTV